MYTKSTSQLAVDENAKGATEMKNQKRQSHPQTEERVIPPTNRNASYIIDYCLSRLKQENIFPYDSLDLNLMPYKKIVQYKYNRKVYLSNKKLNLYRSKITIKAPNNIDDFYLNKRNLTKLCRGYLIVLEANNNVRSPFTIGKVYLSLTNKKMSLNIILLGR